MAQTIARLMISIATTAMEAVKTEVVTYVSVATVRAARMVSVSALCAVSRGCVKTLKPNRRTHNGRPMGAVDRVGGRRAMVNLQGEGEVMGLQPFWEISSSRKRDIFRAWISGRCEYYSNCGEWLPLSSPAGDNASYICSLKSYRVATPSPDLPQPTPEDADT